MINFIKKLFKSNGDHKLYIDYEDKESDELIKSIDELLIKEDLIEIVQDEVVSSYLLVVYYTNYRDLLDKSVTCLNTTLAITVSDYLSNDQDLVYTILKNMKTLLINSPSSIKNRNDIKEFVDMFKFYMEE